MQEKLISIIVPIYNVLDYLERCVCSLLNQTYKNIEILLIDDGSSDGSQNLCDEFEKKYTVIKTYHKNNGGLSSARNFGIEKANGEFFVFVDSDDYVNPLFIEILYNNLVNYHADISICSHQLIYNESDKLADIKNDCTVSDGRELLYSITAQNWIDIVVAWNKLYKREYFESIRYPDGKIHEDEFTTYKILYDLKTCVVTNASLYYYVQRENSIVNQKYSLQKLDMIEAFAEKMEFSRIRNDKKLYRHSLECYMSAIIKNIIGIQNSTNKVAYSKELYKLKKTYHYYFWNRVIFSGLNFKTVLRLGLFEICEPIYIYIRKIKNK